MSYSHIGKAAQKGVFYLFTLCILAAGLNDSAVANDTDVYRVDSKQNCYILMDSSGSMDFPVYESSIDYGQMYDHLYEKDNIYDAVAGSKFYGSHAQRRKIYLLRGNIGLTTATIDGKTVAFTGDVGDPGNDWDGEWHFIDTHTLIDSSGSLSWDETPGTTQRVTVDGDNHILLDGQRLPLGRDILLNDMATLYDGSQVNNGFAGLMKAPGHYFSGYEGLSDDTSFHDPAESGDQDIYFFVTGNWFNMHTIFNLAYTNSWATVWKHESFPIASENDWSTEDFSYTYPQSGTEYPSNVSKQKLTTIERAGAAKIQVHFSAFDVSAEQASSEKEECEWVRVRHNHHWTWEKQCHTVTAYDDPDYVYLRHNGGELQYNNGNLPSDGWSASMDGGIVDIYFSSGSQDQGSGFVIDKLRIVYDADSYTMQTRLDVAKEAILYVIDTFHGKMNWGFASFKDGDGAQINCALNPNDTDDANRAAIIQHVNQVTANGGTPLGEALQDVFEEGYYGHRNSLDNLKCRRNYIISMTDGYPSADTDWERINGVTIIDFDDDNWTEDPVQYIDPPEDYYDDVGYWIYHNSWLDKTVVTDPATSYDNVTTHHIAFGADQPLLKEAAGDSGGQYIAAYNKVQLVAAFYSLALQITDAVSFTAPVVSVDAANKIQNGDDLYLGLFLPQDAHSWVGNLKKYKMGDGSAERENANMLYDKNNAEAIDAAGNFKDNAAGFWGDSNDANDADNYGAHDVQEDGVGEVLTERVNADFTGNNFYERPIYTYVGDALVKFNRDNITAANLAVSDDLTRDQIINYVYGYTNEADATTGAPLNRRDWALGSIIHSSPVVVDYYDTTDTKLPLAARYIVVGANDGMLHVFKDSDGSEIFAFIPEDILPKLQLLPTTPLVDTVDGKITLYRSNKNPKYLIFGLRRGGKTYWCLDVSDTNPLNWTVKWQYTNAEMAQSWAKPQVAAIPVSLDATTGEVAFRDIVIFSGGYDPEEDNYPEPFFDADHSGSPFKTNGAIDPNEWKSNDGSQDVNGNDQYDRYNPGMNEHGRGIFAVDIDDPTSTVTLGGTQILPFSITYNASAMPSMKYCFPATPAVVSSMFSYIYKKEGGLAEGKRNNVLRFAYAPDIYSNIYKLGYDFEIVENNGAYSLAAGSGWHISRIFAGNPGGTNSSGEFGSTTANTSDQGRKTFYAPAVSWGGACSYFDAGNYGFPGVQFAGQYDIAALYMGTGDREHPSYTMIRNRLYAIYDDISVTASKTSDNSDVTVSTAPYGENDLLNLSCDELDEGTTLSGMTKDELKVDLTDDATRGDTNSPVLENGTENDAKGWYVILEDQGDDTACSHCTYSTTVENSNVGDADNHHGEKILSEISLYSGGVYFTSYQPSAQDPCNPQGNGFVYALNYCDGTAYFADSNQDDDDVTQRYRKVIDIDGIPSEFAIITRLGGSSAMSMMGGKIIILDPKGRQLGLDLYYWREIN